MAEWLVEHGIGESRALLIDGSKVLAARLHWPGELAAGFVEDAVLVARSKGGARGRARFASGEEALVDRLPKDASEGATIRLEVTRPRMAEVGRQKLAQARPTDEPLRPAPNLEQQTGGKVVRHFPAGLWEEVWQAASQGTVDFAGGSLLFSVTPAMTLIDIDGEGSPRELALAAIPALANCLRQFDLGGSIGIDFPTISDKAGRKAVDEALSAALAEWPHERTAMNGFGFVQLVARLECPSLLHRFAQSRVATCARMAMRSAELVEEPGALLLTVHPALKAKLKPGWLEELARRTGREVRIATDPALALEAGFAQAVPL